LKGARGRGTLATEKPPILGMILRSFIPMNTRFMTAWSHGDTREKAFVMVPENMRAMRMVMGFMKCM
jgi:hypothetical protein